MSCAALSSPAFDIPIVANRTGWLAQTRGNRGAPRSTRKGGTLRLDFSDGNRAPKTKAVAIREELPA